MYAYSSADLERNLSTEWLLTNGLGGFASSSVVGANTRRYHGLLVAALNPPTDRRVLISKVDERIITAAGAKHDLGVNQYPGAIHPQGYQYIQAFERNPLPRTDFAGPDFALRKTLWMPHGRNAVVLEYQNTGEKELTLQLDPWWVYRDYHSLFRANDYFDFYREVDAAAGCKIYPHHGAAPIYVRYSAGVFHPGNTWYYQLEYCEEKERGLDYQEDAKSIGYLEVPLPPGEKIYLSFSTDEPETNHFSESKTAALQRFAEIGAAAKDPFLRDLLRAGDQFLVTRQATGSQTLIAGYPWFTDWGRDTMIAMRGLTIATGQKAVTEDIIRTFLQYLDQGMLPNRFPDQGETPEYNTIDATLWLFIVLHEYDQRFGDATFLQEVYPALLEVLDWHQRGTRYNIHETAEGLLFGGEDLAQLTWMDARVGDFVVTPRQGCPVEINALWYNAWQIAAAFAAKLGHSADHQRFAAAAHKTRAAFRQYFRQPSGQLYDVVIPELYQDDTFRPNQIYALSLPFPLLDKKEGAPVLKAIETKLYTDLGLRSLDPADPQFRPTYGGDQWSRDTAYHQGTVWAFLWGEYALACLHIKGDNTKTRQTLVQQTQALQAHFYENDCLWGISEIFDGAEPSRGKGCFHQAWSVGMLIKAWVHLQNITL